jgi:arsenite methyltransferase
MGLSCGNPTATANLRPGEVVVDLGSGGGLDVFLAARKVGPTGKAIGIDMTPEMLVRARENAKRQGLENVEFYEATIDNLPLPDGSVDCVISNCVINLAPDKSAVLREIARVLKPGGRVAVSDIALKKPLPPEIGNDLLAYVGCIAGAISIDAYVSGLKAAGFDAVQVVDTGKDLNAYSEVEGQAACCAPPAMSSSSGLVVIGERRFSRPESHLH